MMLWAYLCGRFAEPLRTGRRVVNVNPRRRPPEAHAPAVRGAALMKTPCRPRHH